MSSRHRNLINPNAATGEAPRVEPERDVSYPDNVRHYRSSGSSGQVTGTPASTR